MHNFILQAGANLANAVTAGDSLGVTGIQTATGPEITETKITLFEMVSKGGPIMIPLAILLIVAIYILVERLLVLSKASKSNDNLILSIKEMIHSGNIANAIAMCKNMNTAESTMIEQGV